MTPAQRQYLDLLGAAEQPIKIPAGTAAVLERDDYATRVEGGHVIAEGGRRLLARQARDAEWKEVRARLTPASREFADRVILWMRAHRVLASAFAGVEPSTYHPFYGYAEYVIRAGIDGVPIVDPPGKFEDAGAHAAGWIAWVIDAAQTAATLLAEYDEQAKLGEARGRSVTVSYEAVKRGHPNSVGVALERAQDAAPAPGTIDLATFRERRPKPTTEATA